MSENILELLKSFLTGPIVHSIAEAVGLPEDKVRAGLEGAFSAVLAGMLQKASQPEGAESLLNTLKDMGSHADLVKDPGAVLGSADGLRNLEQAGSSLLKRLFGEKLENLANALGGSLGLPKGVVSTLLALAGPMIMSQIGKLVAAHGLNASGLLELLMGQKKFLQASAPPGLASALGLNSLADLGTDPKQRGTDSASTASRTGPNAAPEMAPWLKWALPVGLLAALALLGVFYALRPGEPNEQLALPTPPPAVNAQPAPDANKVADETVRQKIADADATVKEKMADAARATEAAAETAKQKIADAANATGAAVESVKQKVTAFTLPGGVSVELPEHSGLDQLATYLQNPKPDASPVIPLPVFAYEPGTTRASAEALTAMDLLAKVLKAYPAVTIKLVGHPETISDSVQQKAEALRRANDAKSLLVERGSIRTGSRSKPRRPSRKRPLSSSS